MGEWDATHFAICSLNWAHRTLSSTWAVKVLSKSHTFVKGLTYSCLVSHNPRLSPPSIILATNLVYIVF